MLSGRECGKFDHGRVEYEKREARCGDVSDYLRCSEDREAPPAYNGIQRQVGPRRDETMTCLC